MSIRQANASVCDLHLRHKLTDLSAFLPAYFQIRSVRTRHEGRYWLARLSNTNIEFVSLIQIQWFFIIFVNSLYVLSFGVAGVIKPRIIAPATLRKIERFSSFSVE